MATSGNGTFIPMVSSSPPPMDDGAFDDDDDEFSNFSSAPLGLDSPPGKWAGSKKGSFEPIKSDPTDPFHSTDDSDPSNKDGDFGTFAAFGSSSFSHDKQNSNAKLVSNNNVGGLSLNGNESDEEDEFADFASFKGHPVEGSNKKDGSSIDSGRQNEENVTLSSIVLNKNNSHENCESHNTDYRRGMEKHDNDLDVNRDKHLNQVGYSDDSTSPSGMSPHSEMPPTGIKTTHQGDGGMFADFHSRIPSQSSFDVQEPAHKHKDMVRDNDESDVQGIESDPSAAHLEKPSTGSLSLFRESDRQTFDSGIDSIMTPSDSSPEGKDDCSGKEICEEDTHNNPSQDIGPDTSHDDEWGDFDTFSSTKDNQTKQSLEKGRTETVHADAEMSSSKTQNSDGFDEFGSHSRARTQQQPSVTDDAGKGVLSNSESLHKSNSGNITSSLSTPQNETPVQCDDDDDDDFGNFSNAKQASTDNKIPSTKQGDNDDDFDDFGDFASTKSTSEREINKQAQDKSDNNWGKFSRDNTQTPAAADDFGDFGSFGSNTGSAFGTSSAEKPRDDEFGTFSSNAGSGLGQTTKSSSKSDDFGSFGSSRPVSGSLGSGTGSVSSKIPPGGRVERLFKSCFPRSMEGTSSNQPVNILQDIVTINKQLPSKGKADKSTTTSGMVWHSLSDMENTMAQKYHWNDSKNSGKLLSSLGIDSRNILPPGRGGRPLFAQELGMLTPSKPGEISDKIPLGGGGASGDVSSGAEDGMSTTSSVTEDTVPKVEFDWSNSGLINPLDVQKVDPELLDFAVSPSDPPLQPALTPSSSSSNQSSTSSSQRKSPNALDEILKHSSSSMVKQKPKREAGLSSEANAVLDSLPDLSYMLAKVLMFPVASSHSSSPSKTTKADAGPGTSGWAESIS